MSKRKPEYTKIHTKVERSGDTTPRPTFCLGMAGFWGEERENGAWRKGDKVLKRGTVHGRDANGSLLPDVARISEIAW